MLCEAAGACGGTSGALCLGHRVWSIRSGASGLGHRLWGVGSGASGPMRAHAEWAGGRLRAVCVWGRSVRQVRAGVRVAAGAAAGAA